MRPTTINVVVVIVVVGEALAPERPSPWSRRRKTDSRRRRRRRLRCYRCCCCCFYCRVERETTRKQKRKKLKQEQQRRRRHFFLSFFCRCLSSFRVFFLLSTFFRVFREGEEQQQKNKQVRKHKLACLFLPFSPCYSCRMNSTGRAATIPAPSEACEKASMLVFFSFLVERRRQRRRSRQWRDGDFAKPFFSFFVRRRSLFRHSYGRASFSSCVLILEIDDRIACE